MVIDTALYPIDTFKTRSIQGLTTGPRLRELVSLWHGIGAALLPAIPAASVFFVTYEGVKARIGGGDSAASSFGTNCVAAATAEGASCVIRVPAEYLKMKLQSGQATTIFGALQTAVGQGGVRSLYRGLGATLCLDLPFALLQFPLFEQIKATLVERRGADGVRASDGALAGTMAGATAAFCTTPLDVIRTRHVLWDGERSPLSHTIVRIGQAEGLRGFWRGVLPRTVYMGMGGALYLGTYSYCSKVLTSVFARDAVEPSSRGGGAS